MKWAGSVLGKHAGGARFVVVVGGWGRILQLARFAPWAGVLAAWVAIPALPPWESRVGGLVADEVNFGPEVNPKLGVMAVAPAVEAYMYVVAG